MKDMLSVLKTKIPGLMPDLRGAHIVPDPDMLPAAVQYPCAGIKDGDSSFSEGMDQTESESGSVFIYIYVQILKEEASVMGDGSKKGVLELAEDLRVALNWNDLDGTIDHLYCPAAMASEMMFAGENVFVQRKGCRFDYEIT